jgi:thiol-disulfide isomerase/thioredoxin
VATVTGLFSLSYGILWLVVIVQSLALLELVRQTASLRERLPAAKAMVVAESVKIGDPLPVLTAKSFPDLLTTNWSRYFTGDLNLALFLTPRCPHCYALAQDFGGYAKRLRSKIGFVAVLVTSADEARRFVDSTQIDPDIVVVDDSGLTAEAVGINFYPAALLVNDGRLGQAAIVNKLHEVDALLEGGVLTAAEIQSQLDAEMSKHQLVMQADGANHA